MTHRPRGVIVEGPDCSGKTSLVKRLKAELAGGGWDVLQMAHRPGDQFKRYLKVYLEADRLLMDRGHFSEVVYGDLWRGGKHFQPWERALLDEVARQDFVTVLCTAPPEVLAHRYGVRDAAAARADAAYLEQGGGPQIAMSAAELTQAQERFVAALAGPSTVEFESVSIDYLEVAVCAVLDRLKWRGGLEAVLKTPPTDDGRRVELILLEGPSGSGKSRLARRLQQNLLGWQVITPRDRLDGMAFHHFLSAYVGMGPTICIGSHFGEIACEDMPRNGRVTEHQAACLAHYVASRGLVVLCEGSTSGPDLHGRLDAFERLRDRVQRSGVPHCVARTDSMSGIADLTDLILDRVGAAAPR